MGTSALHRQLSVCLSSMCQSRGHSHRTAGRSCSFSNGGVRRLYGTQMLRDRSAFTVNRPAHTAASLASGPIAGNPTASPCPSIMTTNAGRAQAAIALAPYLHIAD